MIVVKINKKKIEKKEFQEIADYFLFGKIVVYPTDTVYGIGCLAEDVKAIKKVFKIKKRKVDKKVIVLVKSFCMVHDNFRVSKKQDLFLREMWAKKSFDLNHLEKLANKNPVTVILKSKGILPKFLENDKGGIAVRIPKDRFLLDLLKKMNKPIISTSLNVSGEELVANLSNVKKVFEISPDIVIDAGIVKKEKTSAIYDISDIENVKIIRK